MIKLFMDTHISEAASQQLRQRGVDVLRCQDVGMENDSDPELLAYAVKQERVMVSCDDDFETLHFEYLEQGKEHHGIISLKQERHCQNIGRLVKVVWFICQAASQADMHNSIEYGEHYE